MRIARADRKLFLYNLLGAQRQSSIRRAKQIAHYIDTVEAAFPNSVILAANYINYGALQEDVSLRWRVEVWTDGSYRLVIPSERAMASVIDGQHRLLGFDYCRAERKQMELTDTQEFSFPSAGTYLPIPHHRRLLFPAVQRFGISAMSGRPSRLFSAAT